MKNAIAIVFVIASITNAFASCDRHTIQYVGDDLIVLEDDTSWETSDNVSNWSPGDRVLVCDDDKMINTSRADSADVSER
jgi:hypothetical protein